MNIIKFKRILRHACKMIFYHRKQYLYLSMTISLSVSIILCFLIFFDTKNFNEYKFDATIPSNVGVITKNETNALFIERLVNMENVTCIPWYTGEIELTPYMSDDLIIDCKSFFVTSDFFQVPTRFEEDSFTEMQLVEGRSFYQEEYDKDYRVVIVDETFAEYFFQREILNETIKIPLKAENGTVFFSDYKVIGIAQNRNNHPFSESGGIYWLTTNFYFPQISKDTIYFTYGNPVIHYSVVSDRMEELFNNSLSVSGGLYCAFVAKTIMRNEMYSNSITKCVILIVIIMILNINMFSTINTMLKERQKEVGIKRAIGIDNRDIMLQFFLEMLLVLLLVILLASFVIFICSYGVVLYIRFTRDSSYLLYIKSESLIIYFIISMILILDNSILASYMTMRVDIIQNIKAE